MVEAQDSPQPPDKPVGRPRVHGEGRIARKFLHESKDYAFKSALLQYFSETNDVQATIDRFFFGVQGPQRESKRKQIYYWMKQRPHIDKCAQHTVLAQQRRVRPSGLGTTLTPAAERALVEWITDLRRDGVPVAASMVQLKAREVAAETGVPARSFTASWEWRKSFLKRHAFSFRAKTHTGRQPPVDELHAANVFAASVKATIEREGITLVYNADQTGVFFEYLPRRTVSERGVSTVWVKCGKREKERLTAMVLGDSSGAKHPLFLVLKTTMAKTQEAKSENERLRHGFGKRVWKGIPALEGLYSAKIYGNRTAWWNGYLTIEFLQFHFGDRTPFSPPVLLLLDDFSGHWVPAALECARRLNVLLMKVPPGLTWASQPADVAWMKPIKDRLRSKWVDFLYGQLQDHRSNGAGDKFQLTPPSREDAVQWIAAAWGGISQETIVAGFRKCVFASSEELAIDDEDDEPTRQKINDLVDGFNDLQVVDRHTKDVRPEDDVLDE